MPGENTTLYAMWARVYTVTYNANGGTGSVPSTVSYQAGKTVTVSINNLTKLYHTDDGWNTAANGSGTDRAEGTTFQMPGNDVVLYSKWESIPYEIGDTGPAGGIIFYKSGNIRLECAPASTEWPQKQWNNNDSPNRYEDCGTGSEVGTGSSNTSDIVATIGNYTYAAKYCYDLSYGGYSDWFLPSLNELHLMYDNLKSAGLGGFAIAYYWASTQYSSLNAYRQRFDSGTTNKENKMQANYVRAVRMFTIT
jgi:hypothetical protein